MGDDEDGSEEFLARFKDIEEKHRRAAQEDKAKGLKTYHQVFGDENYNEALYRCAVNIIAMDITAWAEHVTEKNTPQQDAVFRAIGALRTALLAAGCPDMLDIKTGTVSPKMLAALKPVVQ